MSSTIKIYSHSKKPNLGSVALEIYDLRDGVKSVSHWYTELVGEYHHLAESLRLQGYRSKPASHTEIDSGFWSIFIKA